MDAGFESGFGDFTRQIERSCRQNCKLPAEDVNESFAVCNVDSRNSN